METQQAALHTTTDDDFNGNRLQISTDLVDVRIFSPIDKVSVTNGYYLAPLVSSAVTLTGNCFDQKQVEKLFADSVLVSFGRLEKNWNGYGADKFSDSLIHNARNILSSMQYAPKVFPTGRNSIQFEFDGSDGRYLEFEIYENGEIVMLMIKDENEIEELVKSVDINGHLSNFYA